MPLASFIETDLVLVFDHLTHTLSAIASLHADAPHLEERYRVAERALFEALERTAPPEAAEIAGTATACRRRRRRSRPPPPQTSLGREAYEAAVRNAKDAIAAGEAIQVVLARRQSFESLPLGRRPAPRRDRALPLAAQGEPEPLPVLRPDALRSRWSGASPELLLQVEGERMTTHPIAGTRPRGASTRGGRAARRGAAADPKERAEHVMLVDLGRNDLGRVARPGTVRVSKYMEVERYSHVLHLVSHVEGEARPGPRRPRRAAQRLPGRHADRRPEGARDAADRRGGGRATRAVRRRGRLPRLRRQPRHGDHDPERRAQGRRWPTSTPAPGSWPGSVPEREFEETEHKAAALRRAIELAAAVGTAAPRSGSGRRGGAGDAAEPSDPDGRRGGRQRPGGSPMILVVDNYDSFTFNLVQALQAAGADVPGRAQRRDRRRRARRRSPTTRPPTCAASSSRPARPIPAHAGISIETVRFAAERRIPLLGVCLGMQAMGVALGGLGRPRARPSSTARRRRSSTTAAGLLAGHARRASWRRATTRCAGRPDAACRRGSWRRRSAPATTS